MIRNFLFLILTIASLIWIFFAGQELINFSGNENPERLFGQDDGRVLIVNRTNEIELTYVDFYVQPRLSELVSILKSNQSKDERMIISERKAHVVIEKGEPINNERIKELFKGHDLIEVTSKKFLWKEFTIERNKGVMEIYIASEKTNNTDEKWYTFDKKSACSIVQFTNDTPTVTDYYQNEGVISSYCRAIHKTSIYKSINDREMFAHRIPVFITSYQFQERDYTIRHDPTFQESIANKWANMGMVMFEYKNHPFLLMDFAKGKEPILYLDNYKDLKDESNRHYKDLSITKNFPNNPKSGFYMHIFEDHVLFAENEDALLDLEASLELGQMLSLNKKKTEEIFSETPKTVCFREWTSERKVAVTTYNGSSMTVEVKASKMVESTKPTESSTVGFAMNGIGKMLLTHPLNDIAFAVSDANTLYGISRNKKHFEINLKEDTKGNMQWINNVNTEFLITGLTKVHVLTTSGKYVKGFPVNISEGISKQVTTFTWKEKTNFLATSNAGNYFWINEAGEIVQTGKVEVSNLTSPPVAWVSQKRLFFGFQGDDDFAMIEAEKKELLRTFPLPIGAITLVLQNEIVFYSAENNQLVKYNQRGIKSVLAKHAQINWIQPDNNDDNSFYIKDGDKVFHYSENGKMLRTIKMNVNSVDCIKRYEKTGKGSVLGVVDGMANRISLFRNDGNLIPMENNQGQISFGISTFNGQSNLYTISDKFVIHCVL
ncbi:MAG: hypothetical protein QNK75_09540 [Crocinitomicaceae bacterium]|jgi:hypothetical protein